jgi:hypothetical protein
VCVCVLGGGIEFHSFERRQYADRSGGNATNKYKAAPIYQGVGASNHQVEVEGKPITYVTVRVPVMAAIQIMSAPNYWLLSSLATISQ